MSYIIFWRCLTLSLFVSFMGFCFCDGFNLRFLRKLLWYVVFLALVFFSLKVRGEFDLILILSPSILLAILFCYFEKRRQKEIAGKSR